MDSITPLTIGEHRLAHFPEGLTLDCGKHLAPIDVAYCTYGQLSHQRDNAILICNAFTGDQYVAETHPLTGKPGWWERMVGAGKPIDTDKFFVICSNVLGGCMGSTGPMSIHEDGTKREPWGTDFPPITIRDMVRAQCKLVRYLGIDKLFAVIGGSMGGMQVLEWTVTYPKMMLAAIPIATAPFHSAQNIAFNEVGRQAIIADPDWRSGRYWHEGVVPARGLAVARMMAHITYLSEKALMRKFGRRVREGGSSGNKFTENFIGHIPLFGDIFEVESYLHYQGSSFVRRFDANSYLTITRAMDWFDLASDYDGELTVAFSGTSVLFCVISFSSDWLFPTSAARILVRALNQATANVSFVEIETDKGHDAFLLDEPDFDRTIRGFLRGVAEHVGLY
ncbi:MAG: homoserine O-acetyltransferase [Acetobacter sp.]|nr:homoserine O-acetyltransferase [Acetobacter sp.]